MRQVHWAAADHAVIITVLVRQVCCRLSVLVQGLWGEILAVVWRALAVSMSALEAL